MNHSLARRARIKAQLAILALTAYPTAAYPTAAWTAAGWTAAVSIAVKSISRHPLCASGQRTTMPPRQETPVHGKLGVNHQVDDTVPNVASPSRALP
ncbi:hypothetical protein [Stieleria varia]|uniref:Secreted protein n=1 Tax=Stieleria varia TaxID=2528005 RepID=A0A5C6ARW4_9BACT|nr:hypothetical protein [Stieleria varia]TWU02725.1 hypothetical protein Pla52n_37840 [Stieleria varia]